MQLQFRVVAILAPLVVQAISTLAHGQGQSDSKSSDPTTVMIVVLENHNGKRTMETTPLGESACRHAIRVFKEVGPFNITVRSPDRNNITISGKAIEIQCVLPDGSIVGTHSMNAGEKR
jgi:hypothetical protein